MSSIELTKSIDQLMSSLVTNAELHSALTSMMPRSELIVEFNSIMNSISPNDSESNIDYADAVQHLIDNHYLDTVSYLVSQGHEITKERISLELQSTEFHDALV